MKLQMLLLSAFVAVFTANADRVTLKSGSFLTGTAGDITAGVLKFKSDDLGDLDIKLDSIAKLESARTEHSLKYNDNRVEKKELTVENGVLVSAGSPVDMTDVKETDPAAETWHGSVNVAFNADRGNSYGNSATVLANVNRRWDEDRVKVDFGYYYAKSGTSKNDWTKSKDKIELEGQWDHFVTAKLFPYLNARYDRDVIQELDRRITLGAGVGYQWLDKRNFDMTGVWDFNQAIGLAYVNEEYKNPDPDRAKDYASFKYDHHLTWEPRWTKGVSVFHNFKYLPQVDDFELYLVNADLGFTTGIFLDIDLLAKVEWDFNSKPAADRHKSDIRWIIGLGYKW